MATDTPPVERDRDLLRRLSLWTLLRGALLTSLVLGLIIGLHAYLATRLVDGLGVEGPLRTAGWALFAILFASIPGGFWAGRRAPAPLQKSMLWTAHVWIGLFWIFLCTVTLLDLGRAVTGWVLTLSARPSLGWTPNWSLAAWLVGAGVALGAVLIARGRPKVRRVTVPVEGLGDGLRGLRIVQVSDIHIGQTLGREFLQRMVEQVNALEPDVVAVTGDLVEGFAHRIREEVQPLSGLRGKLGVFYVPGNHEFYYGGAAWMAEVARLGPTVLENAHRIVERNGARLAVAGVSDHDGGHFGERHACRPDLALAGVPGDVPRVLLAHQPRSALLLKGLRVDLQLSGHTHGGQIFPFNLFVRLQQPAVAGLDVVNGVRVYTHSGTGYWGPPMRLGAPPEIAVLTLVPA